MKNESKKTYISFIAQLKHSIISSRIQAARLANKEQLLLYLHVGKQLSNTIEKEKWGAKVIEQISQDLQSELPGLRGFSVTSLKKMRQFSDEYIELLIGPSVTVQLDNNYISKPIRPSVTVQLKEEKRANTKQQESLPIGTEIWVSAKDNLKNKTQEIILTKAELDAFFSISFTHHILLLNKCTKLKERLFYMQLASSELLSVYATEHHIHSRTFYKRGKLPNNFSKTLPKAMKAAALDVFKDEYLFDFMQMDDTEDERVFENKTVTNIQKFIMSIGKGFSFLGNQYKIELNTKEYFVDLLFYNRILQCLVAIELKRGKFKPEYAGKLNFYLNVLDDKVKLPNENPSIGIILCKEKDNTEVEYSFKSMSKAMGVATYKLSNDVPKEMKGILPDAKTLRNLLK